MMLKPIISFFVFFLFFFKSIPSIAQQKELMDWQNYFSKHMASKEKAPLKYYANEDFTTPDTTYLLRDVLFKERTYVGAVGAKYQCLMVNVQAREKLNDSLYTFRSVIRLGDTNIRVNGYAELVDAYQGGALFEIEDSSDRRINVLLFRITGLDLSGDTIMKGWFTAEMFRELSKEGNKIIQYYCAAWYPEYSFDNIFVGEIKLDKQWQFFQLAPDVFLMGNLPFYEKFMIRGEGEGEGADFKICKIKPVYLNSGWQFTKGEWLTNRYRIETMFGFDWIKYEKE